jgi:phage shock protein PspC (stress-responsive transcriptional regulator)
MNKRLYRSRNNRMLAGVCGGLGEYFGVDATLIRILFVLLLLPGGAPGLLPYVILWIVMPEQPVSAGTEYQR